MRHALLLRLGLRLGGALLLSIVCALAWAGDGAERVLVVGSEQDYPPFATGRTDAQAGGFTVELWRAVAAESKLNYKIRVLPFHQILQQFKDGQIDVLINLAQSDERRRFAAFTVPHVTVRGALFVRKGQTGIRQEGDLAGKSIIVIKADLAHDYADSRGWGRQLALVDTAAQGFALLAAGRHDALLVGRLAGLQTLRQLKIANVKALDVELDFSQKFAFAVRKDDSELLAKLNEGLALTKSNGRYDVLFEKWFGVYEQKSWLKDFLPTLIGAALALTLVAAYLFRQRQAERDAAERALRASEERWSLALQGAGDGVWDWDNQSGEMHYSPRWKSMLGYAEDDIGNRFEDWQQLLHPEDRDDVLATLRHYVGGQAPHYANEHRMRCKDGGWKWTLTRGMVVSRDPAGAPLRTIGTQADIGERKRMEEELRLAAMVYQALGEAIMAADAGNRIIAVNPAFTRLTGYSAAEAIGQSTKLLSSGRQEASFYQRMWHALDTTGHWSGEVCNRRKDGEEYFEWMSISTIYDKHGGVLQRVAMFSDITDKKRAEETIWRQANYDTLTNLPNRRLFHDRLQQKIKKSQRANLPMALMFLDLDRFKEINDTLGHSIGDILLQDAARRLCSCVREVDTVARLGGDEFTIILSELNEPGNVERVAQDILRRMSEPFQLMQEVVYISVSIGVTLFPNDASEIEDLLKNADQAMYAAKSQGRNRCNYFTASMQAVAQNRMRLASDLRGALADGQFELVYQPICALGDGAIHKAEALLRWRHPKRGLVAPSEFIPIAEETGLMIEIGNWVFRGAARQAAQWRQLYDGQFQISINMSPVQFRSEDDLAEWVAYLGGLGLPGQGIVVEITEGLLLDASHAVTSKLLAFRDAGIQVALDDFGTGYSSLSYLKKFDIDYLKIDQSFVSNLAPGSSDLALCEAIIAMAHKLGLKVIAEGVESEQQHALLAGAGCDYGQGYLIAHPLPAREFGLLLEDGAGQRARPQASSGALVGDSGDSALI